jgi:hypothetical protein
MQIRFLARNPSAFFTYVFRAFDNFGKLIKVPADILFLPLTKPFCFFSHLVFSHIANVNILKDYSQSLKRAVPPSNLLQVNYDLFACKYEIGFYGFDGKRGCLPRLVSVPKWIIFKYCRPPVAATGTQSGLQNHNPRLGFQWRWGVLESEQVMLNFVPQILVRF